MLFIGVKMLLPALQYVHKETGESIENFFKEYSWVSLVVILSSLLFSILLSIIIKEKKEIEDLKEQIEDLKKEDHK